MKAPCPSKFAADRALRPSPRCLVQILLLDSKRHHSDAFGCRACRGHECIFSDSDPNYLGVPLCEPEESKTGSCIGCICLPEKAQLGPSILDCARATWRHAETELRRRLPFHRLNRTPFFLWAGSRALLICYLRHLNFILQRSLKSTRVPRPPCKYNSKPKGCKDGLLCDHCHLCRWKRHTTGAGPVPGGRRSLIKLPCKSPSETLSISLSVCSHLYTYIHAYVYTYAYVYVDVYVYATVSVYV